MSRNTDFIDRYGPWALVAGAAEGLGRAFSDVLAERGLQLLLVDRQEEPLERAAQQIRKRYGVAVETLELDLGAADLSTRMAAQIADKDLGLLVYNAGQSQVGPFLSLDLAAKMRMLDVNCRGPVVLTSLVGERLVARGRGGILLMSSLSGFQGTAMVSTYAATKAFNTILGEGLWAELTPQGVDVLVCAAGATSTPTFHAQTPEEKRVQALPMPPERVAREAIAHLHEGPLYIPGKRNRLASLLLGRLLRRKSAVALISRSTRKMYG